MLVLAFFIAILSLRGMGLAANAPNQGRDSRTSPTSSLSGSAQITITAAGFDPAVLTVTVGTEVTWYNGTGVTHILRFGTPYRIFLPLLMKNEVGGSGLAAGGTKPIPRTTGLPLEGSDASSLALPPGDTFTHRFISTGVYPYFLATAPQFSGQVIVQERPPAPGITGGEKPVTPVYQPPLDDPVGLAINGAETVAYVVEKGAGRLSAVDIDPASPTYRAITPIASGLEDLQMGLVVNPSETYAYVVENEPGTLKQVELASGQVVTITDALQYPHDVVLSLDGTQAYVTLNSGALVRVTVATGQVFTVTTSLIRPTGIALTPDGSEAVVTEVGGELQRVNLTTGEMTEVEVPGYMPFSIALDPSGSRAYVGYWEKPLLRVVDIATGHLDHEVPVQYRAADLVISASGGQAYALWRDLGQIVVMNLDTWETTPILEALHCPTGVALNQAQTQAYVLEQESGELSRIELDPASPDYGRPVRLASVGAWDGFGGSLAVSADETWALVVKAPYGGEPTLLRVDLTTGLTSTVTSLPLGFLRGVVLSPDERFAYVTGDDTVKRVNLVTGAVMQIGDYEAYQGGLNGAALTADGNTLYVAQYDLNRLLKVNLVTGEIATVSDRLRSPAAVALAPGETTAWVFEEGSGGVLTQVNLASGEHLADVPLRPWIAFHSDRFSPGLTGSLALKTDGTMAYVPMTRGADYLYSVDLTGSSNVRVLHQAAMPCLADATLNKAESRAYLVDGTMHGLYQVDTDPTSPTFGTLSILVDGIIPGASQVALSPDEATLVVAHGTGQLMCIRPSDGAILSRHRTGAWGSTTGLALHPEQPLAYVVADDGSLRVVDLTVEENSTLITSDLEDPRGLALNAAGTSAYLVEQETGRLMRVDLTAGTVYTVATGLSNPLDVALDEVGGVAYVSEEYESGGCPTVRKVDLATGALDWAYTGAYGEDRHMAIVLSQDRQHLYLARNRPGALWRINLAEAAAAAIPPPESHYAVTYHPESIYEGIERLGGCLSPDGQRLYLGDEDTPRLLSLDLTTKRVSLVATMDFPLGEIDVAPDGQTAYITRMYTDTLIELDLETGESRTVFTGNASDLVLDPTDPNFVYIAQQFLGQVARLNLSTGTHEVLPVQFEPFPAGPEILAINAAGTHLYFLIRMVGEMGDSALVRLDLGTGEATTVAMVDSRGEMARVITVDWSEQYAYVSELGGEVTGGWWKRGGAVWRVHINPTSPTYGQVELVAPDIGEIGVLALDPTGTRLIVSVGGMSCAIFEVD
jgi:DNA-binding beta-propeller fold protein YncE